MVRFIFSILFICCVSTSIAQQNDIVKHITSYNETLPFQKAYIQTDKPFYKPNETIWFKAYIADEQNKGSAQSNIAFVELINPQGQQVNFKQIIGDQGGFWGDFRVPNKGGIYKIRVRTNWMQNFEEDSYYEKEITVQNLIIPKLLMKIDFVRESYLPGELVVAELDLRAEDNSPYSNAQYHYELAYDGIKQAPLKGMTDYEGKAYITFVLPPNLKTDDVLLNVAIRYKNRLESISRKVPIDIGILKVNFFPEGGDLIANTENTVAFKAINKYEKPVEIEGRIVDENIQTVATIESFHQGMGKFSFTPLPNVIYTAIIKRGNKAPEYFNLPPVLTEGVLLKVNEISQDRLTGEVFSSTEQTVNLIGIINGKVVYSEKKKVVGRTPISISTTDMPIGILQLTVIDKANMPQAERLVFVNKHRQVNVEITTDKDKYLPREKVEANIKVRDYTGKGVQGNFSLAVVDDKILTYADDKQDNILSALLMSNELKGKIYEPSFYFDKKEEKAEKALDLVMMTHGWRKFQWKDILAETEEDWQQQVIYAKDEFYIKGKVSMNQLPIRNAKVIVRNGTAETTTDKEGNFKFTSDQLSLPAYIDVSAKGYKHSIYVTGFSLNNKPKFNTTRTRNTDISKIQGGIKVNVLEAQKSKVIIGDRVIIEERNTSHARVSQQSINALSEVMVVQQLSSVNNIGYNIAVSQEFSYNYINVSQVDVNKIVRNYPRYFPRYQYRSTKTTSRTDFRETLHWNPSFYTDKDGQAKIEWYNADVSSIYRVTLEGLLYEGGVAFSNDCTYFTQKPMDISIETPKYINAGDVVTLPLTFVNNTNESMEVKIATNKTEGIEAIDTGNNVIMVPAYSTITAKHTYKIGLIEGNKSIGYNFYYDGLAENIQRTIEVYKLGFPTELSISSQSKDKRMIFQVNQPIEGTIDVKFEAYPSSIAQLVGGLGSILREPHGCFEQVSSSNYPNIMALSLMQELGEIDPSFQGRAMGLLSRGYDKLMQYECSTGGFDWFGRDPGHEVLTAYGLMEFKDMKAVFSGVDEAMMYRTGKWLMSKRNGKGGWTTGKAGLHSWKGGNVRNAYITYALTEYGAFDVNKEVQHSTKEALKSKDWYRMGMMCLANFNIGDNATANQILETLVGEIESQGLENISTEMTITYSGVSPTKIETYAFIALAMIKSNNPKYNLYLAKLINHLAENKQWGGYGNTQSTIMALKAITAYSKYSKDMFKDGVFVVTVNGQAPIRVPYSTKQTVVIAESLTPYIKAGQNEILIELEGTDQPIPYAINGLWQSTLPQSSQEATLQLTQELSEPVVSVGETVRMKTIIENKANIPAASPMTIISIPGGLTAQPWQLKSLQEEEVIDFYEIEGSYVILYFRSFEPGEQRVINLDLKAEIEGKYKASSGCAYLYYDSNHKDWENGISIEVR